MPPVSANRTITTAATVTESPATAPTERSRSPTTAVSVMPSAAIAATAWVCRMATAVAGVANPGMSSENATAIRTPTSTTP